MKLLKPSTLKRAINWWLPFLGSGIKVVEIKPDYSYIKVQLSLRWYNKNYVGTQYGGSLYSMTDPWYMLMLLSRLGSEYIVWDKSAHINFSRPGRTKVFAEFEVTDQDLDNIKEQTNLGDKYLAEFKNRIYDEDNKTIAIIKKVVYIKKK